MSASRRFPGLFLILVVQFSICAAKEPQRPKNPKAVNPTVDFVVGKPITYRNLAVFPVSSRGAKNQDRFITLDDALRHGSVEIVEKGAAGETSSQTNSSLGSGRSASGGNVVSQVIVINRSEKPLYIMPGEIIIGGSQDRTIRHELVIAPDNKPVTVDVFCVEHGRWGARAEADYETILPETPTLNSHGNAGIPSEVTRSQTRAANKGKFIGSIGSLNKSARIAVQKGESQSKVWDEVSIANEKAGVTSKSGAFTANYAESKVVQQIKPYADQFAQPILKTENVVGAIVAINGEMQSIDVFESTPLFKKLWPKLLKSYALDAVNEYDEKAKPKTITQADALSFFQEVGKASTKKSQTKQGIVSAQLESDRVLLFSAHDQPQKGGNARPAMGSGGFGGAIHSSGFAK